MKKLQFWNGRGGAHLNTAHPVWAGVNPHRVHISVCAYSKADARRLIVESGGRDPGDTEVSKYWSPCWGTSMKDVVPHRGIWVEFDRKSQPILVYGG